MTHYLREELYDLIKTDSRIFDFIQAGSLDGIWYWDLENPEHEWMSEKFWTELGYDPAKKPHKASAWQDIINQDDLNVAIENFNKHCADPNHPYDQIVRYKHKNGSTVYIRCRGLAIRDKNGHPIRMLGAHNNITTAMTTAEELRLTNLELKKNNDELQQFTYITSHDLQEPLNSIISYSYLLENNRANLDDLGKKSLDVIAESTQRMKEFITSLLDYSRLDKQKPLVEVDVNKVINDLKIDLNSLIKKKDAMVKYIGPPLSIQAFKTDFTKLLQNLIVNGIKYTDETTKPIIEINAEEAEGEYQFSVTDNGIGIAEEHHQKIFEIFQRLHTRDEYVGTGIGLSYCKKVVDLHNGKIWLTSKEGKGSTFHFTISKA